ncbi:MULTISPECIES: TetR/AcrR family transcriptional regulator [Rhodococcus]|jgi:AcrR family transcriptional regulator|nr:MULTISPECIES: TetR/AcrR family transcriptional regulator [Rhodococcus]MXQ74864.1 TetR family transcriptional regulator [Rhodococcus rhodochrous]BDB59164.1 RemM protein [Rhodococcus sp. RDE2]
MDAATTPSPEQRIADTVLLLLRTKGPKAVTIEAVANVAGMARTTIYRRYRDRSEMLKAVMEPLTRPAPPEPEATAEELLRWVVEQSRLSVDEGIGLGGLAALVTEQEPWFTELMRSLLMRHRQMLAEAIRRHCDDGTVCADLDVETFLDCVVGAYFAEQARRGEVDEDWPARITRTLLPTFAA